MVWKWVVSSVWLGINWWGDDTPINQALDSVSKMETLVSGVVSGLVKVTVSIGFEVFRKWVW